ncbi:MAG: gliding motility-associated C-terminal domain-containing protein [Flavobacteriales bacterium]|nr:gliding motility-associated C-terminal domain-containing protein [Flavobacteriales bacterium]
MRGYFALTIALFCYVNFFAQQMHFQKTFLAFSSGFGNRGDIIRTTDDGYALCSFTFDTATYTQKILLIKTNIDGWTEWSRTYFNPGEYYTNTFAEQTADGGFLLVSSRETENSGKRLIIIRTDGEGHEIWTRLYGQSTDDILVNEMKKASDGFLITGRQLVNNAWRMFLLKLSDAGEILFWKTFISSIPSHHSVATCALALPGGNSVCAGYSYGADVAPELIFIKTDETGDIIWTRTFITGDNQPLALARKPNGNLLVVGRSSDFADISFWDMYIMELDAQGEMLWGKTYGGDLYDEAFGVMWDTDDESIWVLAEPESYGSHSKAGLLHTDAQGNTLMLRLYSEENERSFPDGFERAPDNGFTLFGTLGGYNSISRLWLITTDELGNAPCLQWDVEPVVHSMSYPASEPCLSADFFSATEFMVSEFDALFCETILCYEMLEDEGDIPDPPLSKNPGDFSTGLSEEIFTGENNTDVEPSYELWPNIALPNTQENFPPFDDPVIYIPNAFTPNGDGLNEVWYPALSPMLHFELTIYNRWGDAIFKTKDVGSGWNGSVHDGNYFAPNDVYSYAFKCTNHQHMASVVKGFVVLIR